MPGLAETGVGLFLIVAILGTLLVLLWIALPFAVFGSKPLLRSLLREQQRTNELLTALGKQQADEIERQRAALP
jgi:hypothetical protein